MTRRTVIHPGSSTARLPAIGPAFPRAGRANGSGEIGGAY